MRKYLTAMLAAGLLLAACSFPGDQDLTLLVGEDHYWAYCTGRPMWGTLVWFDGVALHERTIGAGMTRIPVTISRGATAVFALYPLDSLIPLGGTWMPGDGETVRITFEEGAFADLLLDVARYNTKLVSALDCNHLHSLLPEDPFDADALYEDFLDGTLGNGRIKSAKTYPVTISNLPQGRYYSEWDEGPSFDMDYETSFTFDLIPGIHRFYNPAKNFVHVVALYTDGKTSYYNYSLTGW